MNDQEIQEYKALYLQTAKEYVATLQKQIPHVKDMEAVTQLFMSAHSLKSQSLVMNYHKTGILSGLLEKVFRSLKESSLTLSTELEAVLREAIDAITTSLKSIEKNNHEDETISSITNKLEKLTGLSMPSA